MVAPVIIRCRNTIISFLVLALSASAWAGGSGVNVVVVVNQNSTNSIQLGNYYCEKRGVPPQNLLRIYWPGDNINWARTNLDSVLRTPLHDMLTSRGLSNQIEYVVLAMDIPYRVTESTGSPVTSGINSTTAALFYGFKPDGCSTCALPSCNLAPGSASLYAESEGIFRRTPPISAASNSWLTILLTATNLAKAKALVDLGVASDGTFPTQTVFLAKSFDAVRSLRHLQADDAILNTQLRGNYRVVLTNISGPAGLGPMLGFQNGVQIFSVPPLTASPGAMVDNLTSYGGSLFENPGHTTALDFIHNGATASYGTVVEPCAYAAKFPAAQNYFYQARGFSIAECYYQSLENPYQGILVGEPLAAPFALPATGDWVGLPDGALLSGTTNLSVQFDSSSWRRPVQQVDLFLDGQLLHTITNLAPQQNNILYATINGFTTSYTVPAGATIGSVVTGLVSQLNFVTFSNSTKVAAFAHGDRIELQSLNLNAPGSNVTVTVSNYAGSSGLLRTYLSSSRSNFLDTPAMGLRQFSVVGEVVTNDYLRLTVTRTNGAVTQVSVTNQAASSGNLLTDMQIFAQSFLNAINTNATLSGADGVVAEDLVIGQTSGGDPVAQFNLRSRSVGWKEAQIQAQVTGSFSINPATTDQLEDNLNDLRPRNHLYVTAGLTNLNVTFPFNTTTNADGYHELTVVAYEGSHVRTQSRISRRVRIENDQWTATLTSLVGQTNVALEAGLKFVVTAHTNNIMSLELFSTGGVLASATSVTNALFTPPASFLGLGRHPFYAVVTRSGGKRYRTETLWLNIVGADSPFTVTAVDATPTLIWPATPGRSYSILSATNVTDSYTLRGGVVPTNSTGFWAETNNAAGQRFYQVRTP